MGYCHAHVCEFLQGGVLLPKQHIGSQCNEQAMFAQPCEDASDYGHAGCNFHIAAAKVDIIMSNTWMHSKWLRSSLVVAFCA